MHLTKPSALRFTLGAAALVLAVIAQILIGQGDLRWAVAPLLLAAGAIGLATAKMPLPPWAAGHVESERPSESADGGRVDVHRRKLIAWRGDLEQLLGLVALALSLIALIAALRRFPLDPPYTLAWVFFGASVLLLLLALPTVEAGWTRLAGRLRERPPITFGLSALVPWAALAFILILALAVRLYHLQELPAGLWYDEADNLAQALRIQTNPGATPVYVPSTNLPSLFLMPIAVVIELAGVTIATGRLVSVAFGLAGVVAIFLLVRLMLGPHLALVASLLIAVMRWDINWSRIGMHGITAPFFTALVAYLTLRAVRSGRITDFGYAGATLGLGMWFYTPFRLFPLVIGFILLHHLVFHRPNTKRFVVQVIVTGVVALAVAAPVVQSAVLDSEEFFARTRTTSVFSIMPVGDAMSQVWTSLGKHALMFNREGDPNPRHNLPGEPMLDFWTGVLLLIGLGVALSRWRSAALLSLPFWLFFMVVPGVITLPWEAPQSLRSIGAIPAVVVMVTLAFGALWWLGRSAPWPAVRWGTPVVMAALLAGIAFLNIDTYFGAQAQHPEVYASFSTDETLIARHMVEQRSRGHSLFVSRQFLFSLTSSLLAQSPRREVIRAPGGIPIDSTRAQLGVSIYLEPREASVYRLLRTYYPDGVYQVVRPPGGGRVLYYSVVLESEQLERRQGLMEVITLSDGTAIETTQRTTERIWFPGLGPDEVTIDVTWQGALHVTTPGEYLLALEGDVPAEVTLDGIPVLSRQTRSVRIQPAVGLHSLELKARVEARPSALRLLWQPPGGQLAPIQAGNLYHGTVRPVGLAGRFYTAGIEGSVADALHITPAIDTFYYDPVVPEPYLAVWEGTLDAPATGVYQFRVSGFGTVKLSLDGRLHAHSPPDPASGSNPWVPLTAGRHPIRIEYTSPSPPSQLEVLWAPPGAQLEPIPIDRLSPAPGHMFRILDKQ